MYIFDLSNTTNHFPGAWPQTQLPERVVKGWMPTRSISATTTEMSGLFSNKKLNVVDESGSFVRSSTRGGEGDMYSTNFYTGRLRPEVQLLYSFIQFFTKTVPLSYTFSWQMVPLSLDFLKALRFSFPVPVVGPSAKVELSLAFAAENIRKFKSTARASCSWKFWARFVSKSTPSHTLFTPLHPFYPLYMYCRSNRNQSQK